MTRAAPLVFFALARRAYHCLPHLLLGLACLALCIALAGTPPPDRPYLPPFTLEQPCPDDPTEAFSDAVTAWPAKSARTPAQLYAERSGRVACAGVRAPPLTSL
ncbi:hypothetical protein CXK95_18995 [Stutzerimonas degradans]|uniref:Uncharacterized protein n=1 Tax=Stutzerimonas degradans TaxID=2968968 RepID=A0A4P9DZ47_9GAMM|nr:hypothetical protein CXK95_18995 [Stutzerimonas degradans]QCT97386.1 hypothetical protein FEV13_11045 [Stutzerimonas degradans]QPT20764.1 hypothetical protein I6G33_13945 [Stutzerimonas degradans]QPT21504.1 hypothetical protein I6G33_17880 [Stutzerimonas degradans]